MSRPWCCRGARRFQEIQRLWNGDRRDRVKWGVIYHLSDKHRIRDIVWVVFKRDGTEPTLCLYETDPTLQKRIAQCLFPIGYGFIFPILSESKAKRRRNELRRLGED